jgi:activator of 2-hydroxyglutaryl-CoA dehydratase
MQGGADRGEIARGLHLSIVKRAAGMINRVSSCGPVIFSGGVAKNICIRELLSNLLDRDVYSPENPEMTGALGAALIAEDRNGKSTAGAVS